MLLYCLLLILLIFYTVKILARQVIDFGFTQLFVVSSLSKCNLCRVQLLVIDGFFC